MVGARGWGERSAYYPKLIIFVNYTLHTFLLGLLIVGGGEGGKLRPLTPPPPLPPAPPPVELPT